MFGKKTKAKTKKTITLTDKIDINKGMYIGKAVDIRKPEEAIDLYEEWKSFNGHAVVFGTTRVGKTRLMMSFVRQMILAGFDLFIFDPKGSKGQEIIGWVLEYAEEAKRLRDINYISPMFPQYSLNFNPNYYLNNEELASSVASFIEAKEEFYSNMGYEIVMAICLATSYLEKVSDKSRVNSEIEYEYKRFVEKSNIVDTINRVSNPDLATRVVTPRMPSNLKATIPPLRSLITVSDLAAYSTKEGLETLRDFVQNSNEELTNVSKLEQQDLETLKSQALLALEEQIGKPDDYFKKVASSYNLVLSQISTGNVGAILSSTKINPIIDMLYNKDRSNIFIVQPFPLIFKKASDIFVKTFFSMLTSLYGRIGATGRPLPRDVALLIDEGGSVLYSGVEALFNKAGGLGLKIFIFTQAFADFDAVVGPELSRIISDNTNIKIYLRMNDEESRRRVAESFGTRKKAEGGLTGSKTDLRTSIQQKEEELLTAAHVSDLKPQYFLYQYGHKKYMVKGPFVPDAKYDIIMPELESEKTMYSDFSSAIRDIKIKMQNEEIKNEI